MDFTPIMAYLQGLAPWVSYLLMGLGSLVIIGTVVDAMIPDEKDGGFMKKALGLPILGGLLEHLKRYSPLNVKEKEESSDGQ
jgi:hypothetical protein